MRSLVLLAVITCTTAACQRTAEQQQADQLRKTAEQQGATIEKQAAVEANRLQQEAATLKNEAEQAGGMTGERLKVRADALNKEAKIIQKQADMQTDAIRESAHAQIKASKSR